MMIKLNGWTKFIIVVITALIAVGMYITTINANTERSKANTALIRANSGDIREIKTTLIYISDGIDELRGIKASKE